MPPQRGDGERQGRRFSYTRVTGVRPETKLDEREGEKPKRRPKHRSGGADQADRVTKRLLLTTFRLRVSRPPRRKGRASGGSVRSSTSATAPCSCPGCPAPGPPPPAS